MDIYHPTKFGQNPIVSIPARASWPLVYTGHRTPDTARQTPHCHDISPHGPQPRWAKNWKSKQCAINDWDAITLGSNTLHFTQWRRQCTENDYFCIRNHKKILWISFRKEKSFPTTDESMVLLSQSICLIYQEFQKICE